MRNDPASVVEGLYAAWALQDVETVLAYCSHDVCYDVIETEGISGLGGEIRGKDAVRSYLKAMVAAWEFLQIVPGSMLISGDEVREIGSFHCRHRATGDVIEIRKRHVWRVPRGRVVSCIEYQDAFKLSAFLRMARATARTKPVRLHEAGSA